MSKPRQIRIPPHQARRIQRLSRQLESSFNYAAVQVIKRGLRRVR